MKRVRTKLFETVTSRVKATVRAFDPKSEVILFGSRARGDYTKESDWDFLILTQKKTDNEFVSKVRSELYDIELSTEQCFFSMFQNYDYWNKIAQTDIYKNISEDGIKI